MRSLKEMKKKAAAAAFLLLGAVGVVSMHQRQILLDTICIIAQY